ncbi:hypothetical protein J8N08_16600 [Agrobacterium tumefaciens]|uniref:hypothetical protein n=1 Tax=Agrobacterium tumefaciens TaxID=358 RepID=UPI001BB4AB48|nr:hypothetical protein J8N08_16600 [Agrobacterium tumefaciens]
MTSLSLFNRSISERDRAFLRSVSHVGGSRDLLDGEAPAAAQCMMAGFVRLEKFRRVCVTDDGQAYLDRLARAH